ncbi:MAG: hypothetical protein BGO34_08375 [Bacteroidia bacterium 44-10]|nr:MAG: hypothetical protein BGO34_08375 [Bacteroidia bacterium 44-10]
MEEHCLQIPLAEIDSGLTLSIYPEGNSDFRIIDSFDANEFSESPYQILEGNTYEYNFSKSKYQLKANIPGIVIPSRKHPSSGRIVPNIYVGTLTLEIVDSENDKFIDKLNLEVLATKFNKKIDKSYRENYRFMLESITDKCSELLMQINTPVYQTFEIDFDRDRGTVYQRFCFVQSIIHNPIFTESVERIISNPKTNWEEESESTDIRKIGRINNHLLRQIISGTNRMDLPPDHSMRNYGIGSIPTRIDNFRKIENIDTAENRFIKHVLEIFKRFCEECLAVFEKFRMTKPADEAAYLLNKLKVHLKHPFFKNIHPPTSLKLNSPVLQKRSGYREILNRWLQFDFASRLVWKGGDDIYKAGKKDIATLYEYWLFFTLYELMKEKFEINSVSFDGKAYRHLIEPTNDGLNVMLKSGKQTALEGTYTKRNRDLSIKFSYNRTFKGGVNYQDKRSGSWTAPLRPDYTLSIWPKIFSEKEAERNESIVHIHFDAKYKIDNFYRTVQPDLEDAELEMELDRTEIDERKGTYKNVDLLKMHAYKDAIRRSGGAYILYPGATDEIFRGFHEIIPGLGAFSVNPSPDNADIKELSKFIDQVIDHLLDRTSQREKLSDETYHIFKEPKEDDNVVHERIPEYVDKEKVFADEVSVLIGFYKNEEHLQWILKNHLYNFRTSTDRGSLPLSEMHINAKYLILHGKDELETDRIFKLTAKGPRIFTQNDLLKNGYPEPKGELYIVFQLERDASDDFDNIKIDLRGLPQFVTYRNSARPFSATLSEVLQSKITWESQ